MKHVLFRFSMFLFMLFGCSPKTAYEEVLKDPDLFHANMRNLTELILYDIFSSPVASLIYLYPTIASYQIFTHNKENELIPLEGKLKELKPGTSDTKFLLFPFPADALLNPNITQNPGY